MIFTTFAIVVHPGWYEEGIYLSLVVSDSSGETLPDQELESKGIPQTLN